MNGPWRAGAAGLAALALAAAASGCGGDSAEEVLRDTGARLGDLRSGRLDARLEVSASARPDATVGFALTGPFALGGPGTLPVARVRYTQIAGPRRATVTLLSTGRRAFVEVDGTPYRLPPRQAERLKLGGEALGGRRGPLRIESWIREPRLSEGPEVAGAETDRVTATLNVANTVNGLLRAATQLGGEAGGLAAIRAQGARELERSTRRAEVFLLTGEEDRLLRRLRLDIVLRPEEGDDGGLGDVRIAFRLGVDAPNRPVRVPEPEGARPYSQLSTGG